MRARATRPICYALSFVALYGVAVLTTLGQRTDNTSLGAFPKLRTAPFVGELTLKDPMLGALCALAIAAIVWATVRRRRGDAARAAVALVGTYVLGLVFDNVLIRPELWSSGYPYNTYPSGHAAISLAAVTAIIIALGNAWPRASFVGLATATLFIGASALLSFSHRAADVVGGYLLAAAVVAGVGLTRPPSQRPSPRFGRALVALVVIAGFLAVAAALVPESVSAPLVASAMMGGSIAIVTEVVSNEWRHARRGREQAV